MTFKGLKEELSRTMASEKIQLQSYLNAQLPYPGSSFKKKKKTAKAAAADTFPTWEEETDLDAEAETLLQQVFPQAGRAAEKPPGPEPAFVPEGRMALRQAVVFSEIIGEPVCRKRKRKAYGNQGYFGRR